MEEKKWEQAFLLSYNPQQKVSIDWLIGGHNSALILYQVEMETTSNRLHLCQFNKGMEIVSLWLHFNKIYP